MGLIETEGIVLRSIKLGEADKIVTVLSKQEGVVRGVARGARRLKSKFGASLEPFTHVLLTFFEKETRELVSFTQVEIIRSYFELTGDDRAFVSLEYLAGIVTEFAPLRAPDERFFRMMRACLETLAAEPESVAEVIRYCEVWTLRLAGFLPDLKHCGTCRSELDEERSPFALSAGSVLECRRCAGGKGILVSFESLQQLSSALRAQPAVWARAAKSQTNPSRSEAGAVLHALMTRALEREPKSRPRSN